MSAIQIDRNAHYWQTMTHLQKGEWEEALRGLEQLLLHHPDDLHLRRVVEDARYKAKLDRSTHIRTRRWLFPYQKWIDRLAVALSILVVVWLGAAFVYQQMQFSAARSERIRLHADWLAEADFFLKADDLANAERRLNRILADDPNNTNALVKLATVKQERELLYRYQQALAKQMIGDCQAAKPLFDEVEQLHAGYRDVSTRIEQCATQEKAAQLLIDAANFEQTGQLDKAIQAYTVSRDLGSSVLSDGSMLTSRLATLYVKAANEQLSNHELTSDRLSKAQTFFAAALQVEPENSAARQNSQLLNRYLVGRNALDLKDWAAAVSNLRTVYEEQADYLGGSAVSLLYHAYIGLGDGYRAAGDCTLALQRYSAASALPIGDTSLAHERSIQQDCGNLSSAFNETQPLFQPVTVTESLDTAENATDPAIETLSETPTQEVASIALPILLASFHNRILFKSNNQAQPGFWLMNDDGSNRQFLGNFENSDLVAQYNGLLSHYRVSPDGEFHVYVGESEQRTQVFIGRLDQAWPDRPLTTLTGIAYDPQWSPINGAIVFVSQEDGSDDIWFIGADGESQHSLLRNSWEWDKSPSWSPDGSQIVFWSNRTGLQQIYVMNADGKNPHNISNTSWDEFDPLWIR